MERGTLWVVATPIGNLLDLSPRAEACLRDVDLILAEDTRASRQLLNHFGIHNRLLSCHEHNEAERISTVVASLERGEQIALISDAGTPLISDPGYRLVAVLRELVFPVQAIPGASSVITALSISGLPTDRFTFMGFFPIKSGAFRKTVEALAQAGGTTVHFESSHRIRETASRLDALLPSAANVFIARELTKKFEESVLLSAGACENWISEDEHRAKGEFVLVIHLPKMADAEVESANVDSLIAAMKAEDLSTKTIVNILTSSLSMNKKTIYKRVLNYGQQDNL